MRAKMRNTRSRAFSTAVHKMAMGLGVNRRGYSHLLKFVHGAFHAEALEFCLLQSLFGSQQLVITLLECDVMEAVILFGSCDFCGVHRQSFAAVLD
jgi:hypothetical protein